MPRKPAPAKINLALLVGGRRDDGKHEVATVIQRVALADRVSIEPSSRLTVSGFRADTIVTRALEALAEAAGVEPVWSVEITKRVPVAAGLGGGSSDAATALRLANGMLERPLPPAELQQVARAVGADVPFFLCPGPQFGTGEGADLERLDLPQDYWVVLLFPRDARKRATADVYDDFDASGRSRGFPARRKTLGETLASIARPGDLAALPPNDLASSRFADELRSLGAFRADVSGAGPVVYGLFTRRAQAVAARLKLAKVGRSWLTVPAWYG